MPFAFALIHLDLPETPVNSILIYRRMAPLYLPHVQLIMVQRKGKINTIVNCTAKIFYRISKCSCFCIVEQIHTKSQMQASKDAHIIMGPQTKITICGLNLLSVNQTTHQSIRRQNQICYKHQNVTGQKASWINKATIKQVPISYQMRKFST